MYSVLPISIQVKYSFCYKLKNQIGMAVKTATYGLGDSLSCALASFPLLSHSDTWDG